MAATWAEEEEEEEEEEVVIPSTDCSTRCRLALSAWGRLVSQTLWRRNSSGNSSNNNSIGNKTNRYITFTSWSNNRCNNNNNNNNRVAASQSLTGWHPHRR